MAGRRALSAVDSAEAATLSRSAEELLAASLRVLHRRTDRMFAGLLFLEWLACIFAAWILSPLTWSGATSIVHPHLWGAIVLGGIVTLPPIALALWWPTRVLTRHAIAVSQMLTSALLIHLTGGRIETHFHVFGSLAFLAFYRDWPVLITAATTIFLDHLVRGILWPASVYGVLSASIWRSFEHAGWVLFEVSFLVYYIRQSLDEIRATAQREVGLMKEVEERRRTELALRAATTAAEAATRAKSEFLANMSHEIRTPMNGILCMAELALDGCTSDEQRSYLSTLKDSTQILLGILNDILDFSKIEAGRLELSPIEFSVREAIGDMLRVLSIGADERDLELTFEVDPAVPDLLLGDSLRLRQVLTNLVGNAVKFTQEGEVAIRIGVLEGAEGNGEGSRSCLLSFSVRDTGVGIPEEKRSQIFEAFSQADSSTTRKYGGTGLGLAISARLVELMGGHLAVESRVGVGSEFRFTARFVVLEDAAAAVGPVDLAGRRVLVIDDNAASCKVLEGMLRLWQMRPALASDGPSALALLREASAKGEPYSLVLLDRHMPHMDGFAVAEVIQNDAAMKDQMIMMLTSARRAEDAARCRDLGIALHLVKPILQVELLHAIQLVLGIHRYAAPRTARTTLPVGPHDIALEPGRGSASRTGRNRRVLLVEDNPINQVALATMLEKRGFAVQIAEDGEAALETMSREPFDIVLMDVQMPRMSGLEATAIIRARERANGGHVPILAMTARAMRGDREACLAAGMDGYVAKPIQRDVLFAEMEQWLSTPPTDPEILDPGATLDRVDGDVDLLSELAGMLCKHSPSRIAEMRAALESGDGMQLGNAVHSLRNSLGNFAAPRAYAMAGHLETMCEEGRLERAAEVLASLEQEVAQLERALLRMVAEERQASGNQAQG